MVKKTEGMYWYLQSKDTNILEVSNDSGQTWEFHSVTVTYNQSAEARAKVRYSRHLETRYRITQNGKPVYV